MQKKIKTVLVVLAVLKKLVWVALLLGWFQSAGQTPIVTYYDSTQTIVKERYSILNNDSTQVDGPYRMFDKEGRVIIEIKLSKTGQILDTKVVKSLGNNGCDEAAIDAIKKVKWEPAYQRDKPVNVIVSIPVVFRLK